MAELVHKYQEIVNEFFKTRTLNALGGLGIETEDLTFQVFLVMILKNDGKSRFSPA